MTIKPPSKATLRKYGMEESEWRMMVFLQAERCPICHRKFDDKVKSVIDHVHLRNFKKKSPKERRSMVRGILCVYCNWKVLTKGTTLERARAVVNYLEAYEARRNSSEV